jgi:hypothetical protein
MSSRTSWMPTPPIFRAAKVDPRSSLTQAFATNASFTLASETPLDEDLGFLHLHAVAAQNRRPMCTTIAATI